MSDVWINHLSIENWADPQRWRLFFAEAQQIFEGTLTHLDLTDPVREKVTSLEEAANIVCNFGEKETNRFVFGKFKEKRVSFSVVMRKEAGSGVNYFQWRLPSVFSKNQDQIKKIEALFDLGNKYFLPFYAYADVLSEIRKKSKPRGSVDVQSELMGAFWLTYFNDAYLNFFGHQKFDDFEGASYLEAGGVVVRLGESPLSVNADTRSRAEIAIGKNSFVDPLDSDRFGKRRGEFVLTFDQLAAFKKTNNVSH
jgi:hypothetical protein